MHNYYNNYIKDAASIMHGQSELGSPSWGIPSVRTNKSQLSSAYTGPTRHYGGNYGQAHLRTPGRTALRAASTLAG